MTSAVLAAELVTALLAVPTGCLWLGRRARQRGIGGSVLAPLEEVWDSGAHRTNIEIQVQAEQRAPAPSPGGSPVRRPGVPVRVSERRARR